MNHLTYIDLVVIQLLNPDPPCLSHTHTPSPLSGRTATTAPGASGDCALNTENWGPVEAAPEQKDEDKATHDGSYDGSDHRTGTGVSRSGCRDWCAGLGGGRRYNGL